MDGGRSLTAASYGAMGGPDDSGRSGALFVEGTLRYAVLSTDVLQLFSLDGKPMHEVPCSTIVVDANVFALPGPAGERACRGTDASDTKGWVAALAACGARRGGLKHLA